MSATADDYHGAAAAAEGGRAPSSTAMALMVSHPAIPTTGEASAASTGETTAMAVASSAGDERKDEGFIPKCKEIKVWRVHSYSISVALAYS